MASAQAHRCPHDWSYVCFQAHTIHRGLYIAHTQTLRKPVVRVFATPLPKNKQRTRKTLLGMLPQQRIRVISYGLPTGLRTPSNSYGPGTTRRSRDQGIMLWSHETYGWSRARRNLGSRTGLLPLGIPYEILLLLCVWLRAYELSTVSLCAWSLCACPYRFRQVHVQMS